VTAMAATRTGDRLPAYALFGAVLSGAGLPIYMYAPKFFADNYGVSLATLGAVLFGLRLFDVVQDPALGWVAERLRAARGVAVTAAAGLLALSMIGLFAVAPPVHPAVWFGITLTGLFTAFSFLTINFYAQGIAKAGEIAGGHVRLAAWRETGALLGVSVAAVVPTVLMGMTDAPFTVFAFGFAAVAMLAVLAMAPEWQGGAVAEPTPIRGILGDTVARRLLLLALVNAVPLAVSSTLFLFFVESAFGRRGGRGRSLCCSSSPPPHRPPAGAGLPRAGARSPCSSARWCWPS
jgi:glycoside/pentoside/hexuronide:cation symporter, GPH family